jgi:hypothetical protein
MENNKKIDIDRETGNDGPQYVKVMINGNLGFLDKSFGLPLPAPGIMPRYLFFRELSGE